MSRIAKNATARRLVGGVSGDTAGASSGKSGNKFPHSKLKGIATIVDIQVADELLLIDRWRRFRFSLLQSVGCLCRV